VLIVTYHAVVAPASPVCCPPLQLEADLTALGDAGFTFVSLDEVAEWLMGTRTLPARSIAVTFDDGYASVATNALPILVRFRVPATIFVIGERIGRDNQWPGQWKSIAPMRLAGTNQLQELIVAGVTIGSHSWSHPVLSEIDDESLSREVDKSADRLEQILATPIRHFAYPYGRRGQREVAATRRRFRTAVNSAARLVTAGADTHDLNRIDCHDVRVAIRLKLLDDVAMSPYLMARRALRRTRRAAERFLRLT
jgi:peptidoglycan/xylan/chitin deacetylase (PgdA/CDA1 family)